MTKLVQKIISLDTLTFGMVLVGYGLLALDSLLYPGVVLNQLGFDSKWIALIVPMLFLVLRLGTRRVQSSLWSVHNRWLVPSVSLLALILVAQELYYQANYVFTSYGISYSYFVVLALTALVVAFLTFSKNFYLSHWKKIILLLPILLMGIAMVVYLQNQVLFMWLIDEDSVVEWLQFLLLIVVSGCSVGLARYFWSRETTLSILFILAAVGSFFIAGEEISWGQRLLDIATPDSWIEINIQNETNIHNIGPIFGYVYRGYILVGLIGATAWMAKRLFIKAMSARFRKIATVLIPEWYYMIYFAVAFVHNYDRIYISQPVGDVIWEEPMELLLILGIAIFFSEQFIQKSPRVLSWLRGCFHTREKRV
ncbi:MAG: hypothetical protein WDZ94_04335 [Patescibacteria group bacterium]